MVDSSHSTTGASQTAGPHWPLSTPPHHPIWTLGKTVKDFDLNCQSNDINQSDVLGMNSLDKLSVLLTKYYKTPWCPRPVKPSFFKRLGQMHTNP